METPLFVAVSTNNNQIASYLLEKGANSNQLNYVSAQLNTKLNVLEWSRMYLNQL